MVLIFKDEKQGIFIHHFILGQVYRQVYHTNAVQGDNLVRMMLAMAFLEWLTFLDT